VKSLALQQMNPPNNSTVT